MTLKFSVTKIRNCYLCRFIDNKLKLHKMKKVFTILTFVALMAVMTVQAQDRKPDWARWHYLSEEEMNTPVRNENFTETPPPTGEPRFVGEFEPMQGVMIRYPLGIPTSLVVDLSNNCMVYCITTQQSSAQSTFQNAGVNMNNVTFVNAPTDSYWVRDYGPWYIFEDRTPAIVDNRYNRPRPNDDNISQVFANFWNIPMYGMNLEHTGGNMMEDGRGHGVSDELVFNENGNNEENVRQKMREYLGIDPYHVTIDPQGDYIAHVDCWGKYLAPDKILIARLPQSNSHYNDYEQVAQYFENTNCCWGYPYQVFRVDEPGGYTLAPYTNSLILNKSVYVPMGDNATYNQQAIEVYQEAMPGYNIVPVYNNDWSISWENTDALHCRTRGVMDFNMLFVDHRDVLHGEQEWQEEYPIVSKFIAYSGMDLKQDSLLVYYSINGGEYQVAHMTATGNPDEYVGNITGFQGGDEIDYYVFGADESNHRYTQPVFAELDPHHFTVGEQPLTDMGLITETPNVDLTMDNPQIEVAVTNANYASSALIAVSEIMEVDNEYLEIMPEYGLPYSLDLGESFHFIMLPNSSLVGKGTVETTVVVKSDGGEVEFHVTIDEGLLVNVTEISAETKLYPNPTSGNFTVKGADVAKVEVYNLVGQKVLEVESGEWKVESYFDATNWNKGIYLVNIISQNGAVETRKLVVE
jgi:agmatine/peptidylarginine deiminase